MPDKITKFIASLDSRMRKRLALRLKELKTSPYENVGDIKKLKGTAKNVYRLRLEKIRIIYLIAGRDIEIVDIDYRGNIY